METKSEIFENSNEAEAKLYAVELKELENELETIDSDPRIALLTNKIIGLKSFEDLPLKIDYSIANHPLYSKEQFPTQIDIQPKPLGNKRVINGEEIDKPDPLIIKINTRTFSVTPDIGSIKKIEIDHGKVIMKTTLKNEVYDAARMTKLIMLLRRYQGPKNKDINGTRGAHVKEL